MAIPFTAYPYVPDEPRPHPVAQAATGLQAMLQQYMALQAQQATQETARETQRVALAKAFVEGGEDFASAYRRLGGNTADLAPEQALPRTPTSATTYTPTEKEQLAQQSLIAEHAPPNLFVPNMTPANGPAAQPQFPTPTVGAPPTTADTSSVFGNLPKPMGLLDVTPEHLAEIKRKKGTAGVKGYLDEATAVGTALKTSKEMAIAQAQLDKENRPKKYVTREQLAAQGNVLQPGEELMPTDPEDYRTRNAASQLRQQYLQQSKSFSDYSEKYKTVVNSAKNPTAAGDLSMIYAYMKMLDPTSVVREGEFKSAQVSGSLLQRINSQLQQVKNGQRLDPEIRQDFLNRSTDIYRGQKEMHDQRVSEFSRTAAASGLDPNTVVIQLGVPIPEGGGTPDQGQPTATPTVTSQQEYDALPSGAIYLSANGVKHRKK